MKILSNSNDFIDARDVRDLSIQISENGETVWVNADGRCLLRIQKIDYLKLDDERRIR